MFKHFEKDGEFVCYHGQTNKSITAMYNTYRAAQVAYPGESELERADVYCRGFLEEKRASGKFGDKWVIPKDLAGEVPKSMCFLATLSTSLLIKYARTLHFSRPFWQVGYALDFPWRASLPRIETRMYLEQYGGSADVWIGKVLYR
jgi:ent-copalyl diphosphate synthase/syn-copalyl-diphosphate synthase